MATTFKNIANRVSTTIKTGSSINNSDDPVTFNVTDASDLPSTPFYITIEQLTDNSIYEVMLVTNVSGDELTATRAQDDTTKQTFSAGDLVQSRVVAAHINDITTAVNNLETGKLSLDQTTPETISNGIPLLNTTLQSSDSLKSLVNKEYVDLVVTSLGASYYMYDEDDATGYKTCYLDPSGDAETYIDGASLSDDDYIGGWISASGEAPTKLLKGIFNWNITMEKTAGTQTLRVYWKLYERKSDTTEVLVGTSTNSNEISSKATYIVPLELDDDYIPDSGSRIVGKLYADVSGGGSAPTVRIYYQNNTSSCLLYTSPSPRDLSTSRMPSSA